MKTSLLYAKMETVQVNNYEDLEFRILQLKDDKLNQEEELKYAFNELADSFNPILLLEKSIFKVAKQKEMLFEVGKVGLIVGSNFLLDKILGRSRSIKGFLSSVFVESIAATLIEKNASRILSGIGNRIYNHTSTE